MIRDQVESFGFMFLESDRYQPIRLEGLGLETRTADYYFDNRNRPSQGYLFQYTLAGQGMVELDGARHSLEKGQAFLLPLPSQSSYGLTEIPSFWRFFWIMLSGPTAESFCREMREKHGSLLTLGEGAAPIHTLSHIYSLSRGGQINSWVSAQELAFSFLCRLADALENPEPASSGLVERAKELVAREYPRLQGVSDIARRLGVSPEHLSRSFRQATGQQLIELLTKTRLNQAVALLREKQLNLDEIAACGFSSGNYLGKVFKRYTGLSPRAFQKDPVYSRHASIVIFP
jgi:AraC family transcriptional regulator of arabinose operon